MKINKDGAIRKSKHQWHLVDWYQPTSWIADQLGTSEQVVSTARKKYSPETTRTAHIKKIVSDQRWRSVDWSKKDIEIAKDMKASRATVWKARNRQSKQA